MEFVMKPIGVIHSPFTEKDQTPIQTSRSPAVGQVEVYPDESGRMPCALTVDLSGRGLPGFL